MYCKSVFNFVENVVFIQSIQLLLIFKETIVTNV